MSVVLFVISLIGIYFGCLMCASREAIDKAVAYYERDDSYISLSAKITNVEKEGEYYSLYLQYDEQISDLRFAKDFELIPSNVNELQKNGFDFASDDKTYIITVGRREIHNGPVPLITYPVVEIREADDGGKVYLSYETGKSNVLSYIKSKK